MDKTQRLKQFLGIVLQEDTSDARDIKAKESTINLGLSVLMVLVAALHLVLSVWQFVVSLLLVGHDLIAKGLSEILPGPHAEAIDESYLFIEKHREQIKEPIKEQP